MAWYREDASGLPVFVSRKLSDGRVMTMTMALTSEALASKQITMASWDQTKDLFLKTKCTPTLLSEKEKVALRNLSINMLQTSSKQLSAQAHLFWYTVYWSVGGGDLDESLGEQARRYLSVIRLSSYTGTGNNTKKKTNAAAGGGATKKKCKTRVKTRRKRKNPKV